MAKGDPSTANAGVGFFPSLYQSALAQSAEDYDKIMQSYQDLKSNVSNNPAQKVNYSPIAPQTVGYGSGTDLSELEDISKTGGFSDKDIANIRARAIAPIRSVYSSGTRELNRQRNLQGGNLANYGAVASKMARESSDLMSKKTTDAEAAIAELIQRGKLSAATSLSPLRSAETARKTNIDLSNASAVNRAEEFNRNNELAVNTQNREAENNSFDKILETIKGQQSLYGTTPALANTIGSQTLAAANTVNSFAPIQRNAVSSGGGFGINMGSAMGSATQSPNIVSSPAIAQRQPLAPSFNPATYNAFPGKPGYYNPQSRIRPVA